MRRGRRRMKSWILVGGGGTEKGVAGAQQPLPAHETAAYEAAGRRLLQKRHWPAPCCAPADADLAAELEGEHELEDEAAAAPLGDTAAGGGGGAAEAGAQAAPPAAGDASHAAAAAEDAANGPAHPPAEPIAMQLGATGGAGQPVALAGGPTPPAGAAQ